MKREPKTSKKTVVTLTNPFPSFVSLVPGGANGTPLRVVKSDELNQEPEMPKTLKNGNADIARLVFSGEKFKTEAEVQAWLTKGAYTDTAIKAEEDGTFTVAGDTSITTPVEIEVEVGVMAFVGEAPAPVADTTKADVVAIDGTKTELPKTGAQKIDPVVAEARAVKDSTLTAEEWASLKDDTRAKYIGIAAAKIAEETPEPVDIVIASVETKEVKETVLQPVATTETAKADLLETKIVAKVDIWNVCDLAGTVRNLNYLSNDVNFDEALNGKNTGLGAKIKAAAGGLIPLLQELANAAVQDIASSVGAGDGTVIIEVTASEKTAETQETVKVKTETENTEADQASISGSNPVLDAIKGLTTMVGELKADVTAVKTTAEQSAAKADTLAKRLEAVEGTTQTRKSADVEEIATANSTKVGDKNATKSTEQVSKEVRDENALSSLGMRINR